VDYTSVTIQPPDDPYRKLKARAAKAGLSVRDYIMNGGQSLAEWPDRDELIHRLSKLRPLKLAETPEQTIRAMRDGR
jgi:hypothetical protein